MNEKNSQETVKANIGIQFADYIMKQWPDPDTLSIKQWEYTNGIVFYGMDMIYQNTKDKRYLNYIKTWVDKYVDDSGNISPIRPNHNLDVIQPSNLLFTLYSETNNPKYKLCAELTRNKYNNFPVNKEGGFWHKTNYPNEMWLDGIYMATPFIATYGSKISESEEDRAFCHDTAVKQLVLVAKHTMDSEKKLCYHAWDAEKTTPWANPDTGVSPIIWSRAMGWYAMALVDALEYIPENHPGYQEVRNILNTVAEGLREAQEPETGLWYQVLDKGDRSDNWLESTGSAMFVYALKKASNKGYISEVYSDVAQKGWEGIKSKISYTPDGSPVLHGSAEALGVQVKYEDYVSKEQVDNLWHGMAAVLMAASVIEK